MHATPAPNRYIIKPCCFTRGSLSKPRRRRSLRNRTECREAPSACVETATAEHSPTTCETSAGERYHQRDCSCASQSNTSRGSAWLAAAQNWPTAVPGAPPNSFPGNNSVQSLLAAQSRPCRRGAALWCRPVTFASGQTGTAAAAAAAATATLRDRWGRNVLSGHRPFWSSGGLCPSTATRAQRWCGWERPAAREASFEYRRGAPVSDHRRPGPAVKFACV